MLLKSMVYAETEAGPQTAHDTALSDTSMQKYEGYKAHVASG